MKIFILLQPKKWIKMWILRSLIVRTKNLVKNKERRMAVMAVMCQAARLPQYTQNTSSKSEGKRQPCSSPVLKKEAKRRKIPPS